MPTQADPIQESLLNFTQPTIPIQYLLQNLSMSLKTLDIDILEGYAVWGANNSIVA